MLMGNMLRPLPEQRSLSPLSTHDAYLTERDKMALFISYGDIRHPVDDDRRLRDLFATFSEYPLLFRLRGVGAKGAYFATELKFNDIRYVAVAIISYDNELLRQPDMVNELPPYIALPYAKFYRSS